MDILGVRVHNLSFNQALEKIESFIKSGQKHQIATINAEFIIAAQKDLEFKKILNSASLAVPDGTGLLFASKFLYGAKNAFKERVTGVDLTWELAKIAEKNNWSIYLLGAKTGVAQKTAVRLKYLYHNLKIVAISEGMPRYTEKQVLANINKVKPDILLVAFGAPKQEKFIAKNLPNLNFKVAIGVGGTFDFIAETQKRAPVWLQKLGLEWLWRLIHEPKRIGRIYNAVIKFPFLVFWSKIT
ncbi:MAG TPA: WecB/TagA/CpsF family glycosyltransferase [Patescibacteria group bacterium]|nr:WecB/TagA/CpsF family glycosyltransferase [Patescibacteria group bacterium]